MSEERMKILQLLADGKVTAEQASELLAATKDTGAAAKSAESDAPDIDALKEAESADVTDDNTIHITEKRSRRRQNNQRHLQEKANAASTTAKHAGCVSALPTPTTSANASASTSRWDWLDLASNWVRNSAPTSTALMEQNRTSCDFGRRWSTHQRRGRRRTRTDLRGVNNMNQERIETISNPQVTITCAGDLVIRSTIESSVMVRGDDFRMAVAGSTEQQSKERKRIRPKTALNTQARSQNGSGR